MSGAFNGLELIIDWTRGLDPVKGYEWVQSPNWVHGFDVFNKEEKELYKLSVLEAETALNPHNFALTQDECSYLTKIKTAFVFRKRTRATKTPDDAEKKDRAKDLVARILYGGALYTYGFLLKPDAFVETLTVYKNGERIREDEITPEGHPDFYSAKTIQDQKKALDLSKEYLYIPQYAIEILQELAKVLGLEKNIPQSKKRKRTGFVVERAEFYRMAKTKLSNELPKIPYNERKELDISREQKGEGFVYCTLEETTGAQTGVYKGLSIFDREINDAVASLFETNAGKPVSFSPADVFAAVVGTQRKIKPTQKQLKDVVESLDKQMFTKITIDFFEQAILYKDMSCERDETTLTAPALALEKLEIKTEDKKFIGYRCTTRPVLHIYANKFKQMLSIPAAVRDIKRVEDGKIIETSGAPFSYTKTNIALRQALLRFIYTKKHTKIKTAKMRLDKLYAVAERQTPARAEAARMRADISAMGDYWTLMGVITEYKFIKTGKKITHIQFIF